LVELRVTGHVAAGIADLSAVVSAEVGHSVPHDCVQPREQVRGGWEVGRVEPVADADERLLSHVGSVHPGTELPVEQVIRITPGTGAKESEQTFAGRHIARLRQSQ
jgi:hypothetical protein